MIPSLELTQIIVNMSYSSRKRARPDSGTKSPSPESTEEHKQVVVKEAHCTIRGRISVRLGGGLSVFPPELRKFVAGLHIKKTKLFIKAMLHEKKSPRERSFSIIAGQRERTSPKITSTTQ
jgi:hypothetical protein